MSTLHSPSSWEISRYAHHYFAKCFSHSSLSVLDGKPSAERPLYSENSMSIRKGIKKGRFNGLEKIAGHMRPPFGSASLELWLTALVLQLCGSFASGGYFGSEFTRKERRTICDKTSFCSALPGTYHNRCTIHLPKSADVFQTVPIVKSNSSYRWWGEQRSRLSHLCKSVSLFGTDT